jgi:hypothetical protein
MHIEVLHTGTPGSMRRLNSFGTEVTGKRVCERARSVIVNHVGGVHAVAMQEITADDFADVIVQTLFCRER